MLVETKIELWFIASLIRVLKKWRNYHQTIYGNENIWKVNFQAKTEDDHIPNSRCLHYQTFKLKLKKKINKKNMKTQK